MQVWMVLLAAELSTILLDVGVSGAADNCQRCRVTTDIVDLTVMTMWQVLLHLSAVVHN